MSQLVSKKNMKKTLQKYWYIPLLLLLLLVTIFLRFLTPEGVTNKPSEQLNTLHSITPGVSSYQDVVKQFGQPIRESQIENGGKKMDYVSAFPAFPTEVALQNDTVSLTIERPGQGSLSVDDVLITQSAAEKVLYTKELGDVFPLYVYASQGIAIAKNLDGTIFEIWRFSPMTISEFLLTIGKDLLSEKSGPEELDINPLGSTSSASPRSR